jgi:hypothetical protein
MPTDRAAGGGRARVPEGQMPEGQMPEGQMPADLSADGVPLDLGIGRDQAAENPAAQPDEASEAGWLPSGSGSRPRAWPGSRRDEADS